MVFFLLRETLTVSEEHEWYGTDFLALGTMQRNSKSRYLGWTRTVM